MAFIPTAFNFSGDEEQGVWGLPGPATHGLLKRVIRLYQHCTAVETPDVGYFWVARIYLDDRVLDNVEKSFVVRAKTAPIFLVFMYFIYLAGYVSQL